MKRLIVVIAFVLSVAGGSSAAESPRWTAAPHRETVDIVIAHGTVTTMAGPNIDDGAVAIVHHLLLLHI